MLSGISASYSYYNMYYAVRSVRNNMADDSLANQNISQKQDASAAPVQFAAISPVEKSAVSLPFHRVGVDPAELAVRMRIQYEEPLSSEEGECKTCEARKYQDGSNDMGVSFQTPTHIAPENAAAAVRGHEMEHVSREQAKAEREGRRVVSQNVRLHTDICPECGKVYISGGVTSTTTAAKKEAPMPAQDSSQRQPFFAIA